ncbi:MAG: 3'-5' exonuclease, partial [Sphingobacteriales bacterium]
MQPITAFGALVDGMPVTLVEQERPFVVFDFETTGPDKSRDRILQFSFRKVSPTGDTVHFHGMLNPQQPILASATAVHGFTDADVADCPTFREVAEQMLQFLDGCDLVGFHILSFDLPILLREFQSVGINWNYLAHRIIDVAGLYK